jgi:ABC-type antimicrobial peptide transport system permease subunit
VIIGLVVGVTFALAVAKLAGDAIQNVLFNTRATDPLIYASVIALVIVVSAIALIVPARRATRVDPLVALRAE